MRSINSGSKGGGAGDMAAVGSLAERGRRFISFKIIHAVSIGFMSSHLLHEVFGKHLDVVGVAYVR